MAIMLAARFVVRRMSVPPAFGHRLAMGLVALLLLVAVELSLGALLRGQGVADQMSDWGSLFGAVTWALYLAFAAMPALVGRRPP
jgi:hypothetical protein